MKTIYDYITERFVSDNSKNKIHNSDELYQYIYNKYDIGPKIANCLDENVCPQKIDLTNIKLVDDFDTNYLFEEFKSEIIDISNWNITTIGISMFKKCDNLKEFIFPQKISKIFINAFFGCKNLTNINIPDDVDFIGPSAFAGCPISKITLPSHIIQIHAYTFANTLLEKIIIPNNVQSIHMYAFAKCNNLIAVKIPSSVKTIHKEAFSQCYNIEKIYTDKGNGEKLKELIFPYSLKEKVVEQ